MEKLILTSKQSKSWAYRNFLLNKHKDNNYRYSSICLEK